VLTIATVAQLITWLEDAVLGWNTNPTPFVWDGKRRARESVPNNVASPAPPRLPPVFNNRPGHPRSISGGYAVSTPYQVLPPTAPGSGNRALMRR
jgi:hypothetical protein